MPPKKNSFGSFPKTKPYFPKPGPSSSNSEPSTSMAGPSVANFGPSRVNAINNVPKSSKFMNLLQGREMGFFQPFHFIGSAWEMKVGDYNKVASHRFVSANNCLSHTTYFLRSGQNALVAAWYVESEKGFTSVVSQLYYDLNKVNAGRTPFVPASFTVLDACQAFVNPDIIAFIGTNRQNQGNLNIASTGCDDFHGSFTATFVHPLDKLFNCCNSNIYSERFAVGLDGEISIYSLEAFQETRYLSDNIYSMAYNKKGTILHMGCENGDFILYDIRAANVIWNLKLDQNILDDVLVLSDENYCLVSGPSGKLMKVDIRAKKIVLDFPSHNRRSRKIPVSCNENLELVSCTGADDLTRIWSLRHGNLLHSFKAPSSYPARSCFVPNAASGQIHLIQDNFIHIYSMLR